MRSFDGVHSRSATVIIFTLGPPSRGKMGLVATHQTIRLIRGRHSTPERGACVIEVASMLAAEPFTDEPQCVCPVIAEFLRTYNDLVDNERRQDLLARTPLVGDTRQSPKLERRRANECLDWWMQRSGARFARTRRILWRLAPRSAFRDIEIARKAAEWAAAAPWRHAAALDFVEALTGHTPLRVDDLEIAPLRLAPACEPSRSPTST